MGACQSPAAADFNRRRAYLSPDDFAHASNEVENAIHDEWKTHLAPLEAVAGVKAAAREYIQAGHRLGQNSCGREVSGASWADISRAVEISRQSAHERWADKQ